MRRDVSVSLVVGRVSRLMKPPGNLPRGVGPLAVIDEQREESLGRVGLAFDGGRQDDGVAIADDDGPVGLFGEFAGFEGQRVPAELQFDVACLHGSIPLTSGRRGPAEASEE